jgi:uncharacterized protein
MPFDQYHEPANELSDEVRTFARMILSMIEEAEAIDWYEQRMSVEKDAEARAIMANSQEEEFKHFGMDLEWLLRRKPKWRAALQGILFQQGDIVALGKQGEEAEDKVPEGPS